MCWRHPASGNRMHGGIERAHPATPAICEATVRVASRAEIARLPRWQSAFARERKDHRFYELVEDTLKDGFDYGYFVVEKGGEVGAIQPYFMLDQDLLAGTTGRAKTFVAAARRLWPRFM